MMNTNAVNAHLLDALAAQAQTDVPEPALIERDPSVTEQARRRIRDHLRQADPRMAAEFERASASADLLEAFGQHPLLIGLDARAPGDVLAAYWTTAWAIVSGEKIDAGTYTAVARALAAHAPLQEALWEAGHEPLQAYIDELAFQTVLLLQALQWIVENGGKSPPAMVAQLTRTASRQGVDLGALQRIEGGGIGYFAVAAGGEQAFFRA